MIISRIQHYLLLFLFSFSSLFFFVNLTRNPFHIQGTIIYIVISSLAILFIIQTILNKKLYLYKPSAPEIAFLIFCGVCVVSWFVGFLKFPQHKIAVFSEGARAITLLTFNGLLAFYIPIYLIKTEQQLKSIMNALFIAAFISSFYGILQFFGIEVIWPKAINPFNNRCVSTFGNPNFLSSYLVMLIPISIANIFTNRDYFYKGIWFIVTATLWTALVCTATRSSWLGLGCGIILLLYFYVHIHSKEMSTKIVKIILVILILISGFVYVSPAKKMINKRIKETFSFNVQNKAIYQRLLIWSSAYDMFKDHPISGVGWGLFEMWFPFYQGKRIENPRFSGYRTHANNTHNEILELASQVGILGLGIFLWFILCFWKRMTKTILYPSIQSYKRMELVAILAGFTGMLIDNILNVSLHFAVPMMIFWFLVGTGIKKTQWLTKTDETSTHSYSLSVGTKILFGILIIPFIAISIIQIRFFIAEKHFFKGMSLGRARGINVAEELLMEKKHLLKARKFHRYEVNNLYELGNILTRLKAYDQAIKIYQEAITANPGYDEVYFNLGVMYFTKGDTLKAIELFETSNRINPLASNTLYALGNSYLRDPKYHKKGLAVFEKLAKIDPKASVFNNLGALHSQMGNWEKAITSYTKALEIDPNLNIASHNLKAAHKKQKGIAIQFSFDTKPVKS